MDNAGVLRDTVSGWSIEVEHSGQTVLFWVVNHKGQRVNRIAVDRADAESVARKILGE